jgi:hypothetical protein
MPRKQTFACDSQAIAPRSASTTKKRLPEPLPAELLGQRLCQLFSYLWQAIVAPTPTNATHKPEWQTLSQYPLRPRTLWTLWQDADQIVGTRFGHTTHHSLLDVDALSPYHPKRNSHALAIIRTALASIGIYQVLILQSSWSGGLHLYIPLPEAMPTFGIAVALKQCLEAQGLHIQPGQLEIFPNVKRYSKAGEYSEYNAHRLPLQPGSGSILLNDKLQPIGTSLYSFFEQWDEAAALQDQDQLWQAIAEAKKQQQYRNYGKRGKTKTWQQELQSEIEQGWTGPGQTNHLLKTIGCYGVVFQGLSGTALTDYIEQIAIASPGYREWCRHQHEIRRRAEEWAAATGSYYWQLGTGPKRDRQALVMANNIVNFNQQRSEDAQARIQQAVLDLAKAGQLPEQVTARAIAIVKQAQCSHSTLQKYKHLWHPEWYVIEPAEAVSAPTSTPAATSSKAVESAYKEELHTFSHMKGGGLSEDVSVSSIALLSDGEGPGRGEVSFPQPAQSDSAIVYGDLSDVITGIRVQVHQLGWSTQQIVQFIAENFGGKRRSQLTDDELVCLLYRLRTRSLSSGNASRAER